ncbi:MAG: ABC transporter ATP-binding protein [Deltaproteobacteria bacterium]|nr:ABC transporter ATP-binding protein [Deltaproteobacteria bacterium]
MKTIECKDIHFSYKAGFLRHYRVLKGLSFDVDQRGIYGFLGINGSGKTTTIKLLNNFIKKDSGTLTIFGFDAQDIKARAYIGYMPENPSFYVYLNAKEFLTFISRLKGVHKPEIKERIDILIKLVGLERHADMPISKYSRGMSQRLGLAQALIGDPELLILDEPMANLDPIGRRVFREIFFKLKERGKTLFFSTHIIPDVEMICDKVGILMDGRIAKEGSIDELLSSHIEYIECVIKGKEAGLFAERHKAHTLSVTMQTDTAIIRFTDKKFVDTILKDIVGSTVKLSSLEEHTQSLEDIFVHEAGRA